MESSGPKIDPCRTSVLYKRMLWLTLSNAFDKSINTPNIYLFSLKELYILFTSYIRACSVE